jgi:ribosomal protein S18 acetylase RimI-like enzyme
MQEEFAITHTDSFDLSFIFELFEQSILYQEAKGYPVWKNYDKDAIIRDVHDKNQYKAVNKDGIGIVFSVSYRDKIIWREHDQGESIYLHRIVVNPAFKGRKLFGLIVQWAIDHIKEKGLTSIRMDTWASNTAIINYYKSFGFEVVENYTTPETPDLPVHNRNLPLTLMEYRGNLI